MQSRCLAMDLVQFKNQQNACIAIYLNYPIRQHTTTRNRSKCVDVAALTIALTEKTRQVEIHKSTHSIPRVWAARRADTQFQVLKNAQRVARSQWGRTHWKRASQEATSMVRQIMALCVFFFVVTCSDTRAIWIAQETSRM